ncbi:MAG: flagellar basal body L-ring protein FlgH [Gammaproteobacteria bacterium]|nr:MAG: flagellar basal body L-ring protein FlgH [Gammaproteobacteria bacterium]
MNKWIGLPVVFGALLLSACGGIPEKSHSIYGPAEPIALPPQPEAPITGSLYGNPGTMALFEDMRAHQVGDILTVILSESTNASKSADTSLGRKGKTSITNPTLAGQTRIIGTDSNLGFELNSASDFTGESASAQNNTMQGTIAVTVGKVLPNGNLYVQGEKWIKINQGNEYIRLRGILRPVDISTNNTVLSTQIADARISYSGTGSTADVNMAGWLSRFFMSPLWPF